MPEGLHADVLGVFTLANISQANRFRGSLMGLAVGDAVGTTVEFMRPGTFEPVTDMVGGGPFYLKPGQWTDDTSLALCLAESLVQCGGFNAADQMSLYTMWYRTGYWSSTGRCFDIGNTTRESLHKYEETAEPMAGSSASDTAGNGSVMRLAPVPLFCAEQPSRTSGEGGKTDCLQLSLRRQV